VGQSAKGGAKRSAKGIAKGIAKGEGRYVKPRVKVLPRAKARLEVLQAKALRRAEGAVLCVKGMMFPLRVKFRHV